MTYLQEVSTCEPFGIIPACIKVRWQMEGSEFIQMCSKRGVEENIEARNKEDYYVHEGADKEKHK